MVSHSSTWFPILKPACKQMFMSPLLPLLKMIVSLGLRTTGAHVSQEFCTHGWHYHHVYKPREAQPRLNWKSENWKTLRVWGGGDRPPPASFFSLPSLWKEGESVSPSISKEWSSGGNHSNSPRFTDIYLGKNTWSRPDSTFPSPFLSCLTLDVTKFSLSDLRTL